jgi:hypothetical protein
MGCFLSKKQSDGDGPWKGKAQKRSTKNNNNIMLLLRSRESGKKGSNGTGGLMENYIVEVLRLYADNTLYNNGPTYQLCINAFRENVPVNSYEYEKLREHFNWLRFDMEPHALFLNCHVKDFVGHMQLATVNYLVEIGHEPVL